MNTKLQQWLHIGSVASLLGLIILCTAWELWLAPLHAGGSWVALKALPLLLPLAGVIRRNLYTMQWASMLVLLYFIEGIVRGTAAIGIDQGLSAVLAWAEVALVTIFFCCSVLYLRPYKQAAKRLAREAIEKAANSKTYK